MSTHYDPEAFRAVLEHGAAEGINPSHPTHEGGRTYWRCVAKRGALFDLGRRVMEASDAENDGTMSGHAACAHLSCCRRRVAIKRRARVATALVS